MFECGDYVIYKRDLCRIKDVKKNYFHDVDYYGLTMIDDPSLKLHVPVINKNGYLRNLISKDEVEKIIREIPKIEIIESPDKMIENNYKALMSTGNHYDLIKIIKTAYLRNQNRIDNNKKTSDKDSLYFDQAERYLYNEFSAVLGIDYDATKDYVISKVMELENH